MPGARQKWRPGTDDEERDAVYANIREPAEIAVIDDHDLRRLYVAIGEPGVAVYEEHV